MQIKKNSNPERSTDNAQPNLTGNGMRLSSPVNALIDDERRRMVAEAAYFRSEKRGFREGDIQQDWLEAEAEIKSRLEQGT